MPNESVSLPKAWPSRARTTAVSAVFLSITTPRRVLPRLRLLDSLAALRPAPMLAATPPAPPGGDGGGGGDIPTESSDCLV